MEWRFWVVVWTVAAQLGAGLPHSFGYQFRDDHGTVQSREEKTEPDGAKSGSYSFLDAAGLFRRVEYVADGRGFRATVTTNEPGTVGVDPADVRMRTHQHHQPMGSVPRQFGAPLGPGLLQRQNSAALQQLGHPLAADFGSCPEKHRVFPGKHRDFPVKHRDFPVKHRDFLVKHRDFPEKHRVFPGKHRDPGSESDFAAAFALIDDRVPDTPRKRVPTRHPGKQTRDPRRKGKRGRKPVLKIHVPSGSEDDPDLPLYRDK